MRIYIIVLCTLVYLLGVGVVDVAGLEDMSDMSVGLGEGFSIRVVGLEVVGKRGVLCLVDMGGVYATLYLSAVFKLPDNSPVPTPLVIYRKLPYRNTL